MPLRHSFRYQVYDGGGCGHREDDLVRRRGGMALVALTVIGCQTQLCTAVCQVMCS